MNGHHRATLIYLSLRRTIGVIRSTGRYSQILNVPSSGFGGVSVVISKLLVGHPLFYSTCITVQHLPVDFSSAEDSNLRITTCLAHRY